MQACTCMNEQDINLKSYENSDIWKCQIVCTPVISQNGSLFMQYLYMYSQEQLLSGKFFNYYS